MKVREPGGLAEVGALAGHLKMEPLLRMVFLGEGGEGDFVFGVVLLHQIFDDGARFEDGNVCVGVADCGNAAAKDRLGQVFFSFCVWLRLKEEKSFYRPLGFTSVYGCSLTDLLSR